MKKIAIALLAGSGALLAHSAMAADISMAASPIGTSEAGTLGSFVMNSGDVIEQDHAE